MSVSLVRRAGAGGRAALLRVVLGSLLCFATLALGRAARGAEPIVTTDLLRMRDVTTIDVALDGSRAVYAVRSIRRRASEPANADGAADDVEKWANESHLFVIDLGRPDEAPRQYTFGERFDHAPSFSPDGRQIAFVRGEAAPGNHDDDDDAQVWIVSVDGGEARQVTDLPHGAEAPRWSPDGRTLLVASRVPAHELEGTPAWSPERPGRADDVEPAMQKMGTAGRPDGTREEIRAWLDERALREDPSVITRLEFQDEQALKEPLAFRHLFAVDPSDPAASPRRITSAFRDHDEAIFTPDGASILFTARRHPEKHPDRVLETAIFRMPAAGGPATELVAIDGWAIERALPAPDGTALAILAQQLDEPAFRPRRLGLIEQSGDGALEPVWITDHDGLDVSVTDCAWQPAQSSILFSAPSRGGFPLWTMDRGLIEPAVVVGEVDGMPAGVRSFAAGGGAIVYALTTATNPCVLRVLDARGERTAHDLNPWVAERDLSRPVRGVVTRPYGLEVEYWLMEPTNRVEGRTYPLVLEIHGGPSAMWGPGEFTMWHEFQLLSSWGFGVVYANPRGSGGYGHAFCRANAQNWGDGPGGDVLAVVDRAVLEEWVDAQRLLVTGGSYGGYLTAWIVAHDHRFKAAVAQRGVYDLTTFFGEGNAWRLVEWCMGGFPWDPRVRPILERESPFSQVHRIRTPLLILHASQDLRTGVSQSEMLYRALKQLGRPVEYVRYPGAGHDLSRTGDPGQRMDRLNRIVEFFERFVENPRPAPRQARPDGGG